MAFRSVVVALLAAVGAICAVLPYTRAEAAAAPTAPPSAAGLEGYPESDYLLSFDSTLVVSMVVRTPLALFDSNAFRNNLYQNYLIGGLSGDTLNSDSDSYKYNNMNFSALPSVEPMTESEPVPQATPSAAEQLLRTMAKDELLSRMVILEVCGFDVTNRNALLTKDGAFENWPLQRCGETYNGVNNGQQSTWGGTLVRFSFLGVPWMVNRMSRDAGLTSTYANQENSATSAYFVEEDRKYLVNSINWMKLIGHTAPSSGATAPAVPTFALSSMAYTPNFGLLSGRPLATVATWGVYARPAPRNIAEFVSDLASNTAVVVIVILILVLFVICCCGCFCYCRYCRDKPEAPSPSGNRRNPNMAGSNMNSASSRTTNTFRGNSGDGKGLSYRTSRNNADASAAAAVANATLDGALTRRAVGGNSSATENGNTEASMPATIVVTRGGADYSNNAELAGY